MGGGGGQFCCQNCFLKNSNTPKYAQVLVVTWVKLSSVTTLLFPRLTVIIHMIENGSKLTFGGLKHSNICLFSLPTFSCIFAHVITLSGTEYGSVDSARRCNYSRTISGGIVTWEMGHVISCEYVTCQM